MTRCRIVFLGLMAVAIRAQEASNATLPIPVDAIETENNDNATTGIGITLDMVDKIMLTEVQHEMGTRRLTRHESNHLWRVSVTDAWVDAQEREGMAHIDRRREQRGKPKGTSPFLVCDMRYGETGESCKENVQSALGHDNLIPLYNKVDMTCFAAQGVPSQMEALSSELAAIPFSPEMKMGVGTVENIDIGDPMVARIEGSFCSGEIDSDEEALNLATDIVADMNNSTVRRSRLNRFLESRQLRYEERAMFWHRQLKSLDGELCSGMLHDMQLEVSQEKMMLILDEDMRLDIYRECLHSIAVQLADRAEICFVGAFREIETFNVYASGIVQSGSSSSKPFFESGLNGTGQVIGLSDTGVDGDNCYFWDKSKSVTRDRSGTIDSNARKIIQYYAYVDSGDFVQGHGTHTAGSLVGRMASDGQTENDGLADGIARGAKLAFVDLGTSNGGLVSATSSTLFNYGYSAGARVHSASWGTPGANAYSTGDADVDSWLYRNPDMLFVVAAGNSGTGNKLNTVSSPAICKNGLAVGASENSLPHIYDENAGPDYLADFSSRGPTADGRRKPEIMAPGMYILSAQGQPSKTGECDSSNGIMYNLGTSMATPVVSGTATLLRQYFVQGWWKTGSKNTNVGFNPRSSLLKAVIVNGADGLKGIENGTGGTITSSKVYDNHQGFGRVNLLKSVPLSGKNNIKAEFVNAKTIGNGGHHQIALQMGGCSAPLSATLAWTDPAVGANCNKGCVLNDLDLYITKSGSSSRYYPNGLSQADDTNNVERVRIASPTSGIVYTVHVVGSELIQNQVYSLVVTGCFSSVQEAQPAPNPAPVPTAPVATPVAPSPVAAPSTQVVTTSLNGDVRWYGIMFGIKAKTDLTITNLDVHLNGSNSYRVRIWIRYGGLTSSGETWSSLTDTTVTGKGYGKLTALGDANVGNASLRAGQEATLYVTLVSESNMVLKNENGSTFGTIFSNNDIEVGRGNAVTYLNARSYTGYSFNGQIYYQVA